MAGLSNSDKIIEMEKNGDHYEASSEPSGEGVSPDMDPFKEFDYKEAKKSGRKPFGQEKYVFGKPVREQVIKVISPEDPAKRRRQIIKGIKETFDGAETIFSIGNDILKRIERISKGK